MKIYKNLTLLVLVVFTGLLQYKAVDWDFFEYEIKFNKLGENNLTDYFNFIVDDMRSKGVDVDSILAAQTSISVKWQDLGSGTIGRANGMFNHNVIDIGISKEFWDKFTPAERLFVMYHEVGHDMFYLWHWDNWIMSASKSSTGPINLRRIWDARDDYVLDINTPRRRYGWWAYEQQCNN